MSSQAADNGLLKISELAERSGVSTATIRHYLREGLLPEPVKTSRNMAYYPPEFVERIRRIKELQERQFMPLRLIKGVLDEAEKRTRISRAEARRRYEVPNNVLGRLEEIGLLTPNSRGYDADDLKIIEAVGRFRAGGWDEQIGFTVYDTLRYREALQPLVEEEVQVLLERMGEVDPERALAIIAAGAEPLRDLIGAVHSKLLVAELQRKRVARA